MLLVIRPRPDLTTVGTEVLEILQARVRVAVLPAAPGAAAGSRLAAWLGRVVHVIACRASPAALDAEMLVVDKLIVIVYDLVLSNIASGCGDGLKCCRLDCREDGLKSAIGKLLIADKC